MRRLFLLVCGIWASIAAAWPTSEFVTSGPSMLPTLPIEPTRITVERVPFSELRKGDVVVYRHKRGGYWTHRLFKRVSNREWWPRGDHNRLPDDDYVTPENLIGRVLMPSQFNPNAEGSRSDRKERHG